MNFTAIPFKQEGKQMYLTVLPTEVISTYGKVDIWNEDEGTETGYQRKPEKPRAAKVASFLRNDPQPLMPTSILLSYRGVLKPSGGGNGTVTLSLEPDDVFWIVDGQHRVAGLELAISDFGITRLEQYPLPVVIVEFTTEEEEANQFRVINETMKKVRTDLARRLLASRLKSHGRGAAKQLREEGRLWEAVAVDVIKGLNNDQDSPWFHRVQKPGEKKTGEHVIRELSLSTSLKPILTQMPYRNWTTAKLATTIKEYWKAWSSILPDAFQSPVDYVVQKTPGAFSLHLVAWHVLEVLRLKGVHDPKAKDFVSILEAVSEFTESDYWKADTKDGAALAGSMKGFGILADGIIEELVDKGYSI